MSLPPPIPVRALPVEPVGYHMPDTSPRRPGWVTAIGVASIVVASFGLLANIGQILQGLVMLLLAAMNGMTTRPTTQPAIAPLPPIVEFVRTDGLDSPSRQIVLQGIQIKHPLSPPRTAQLELLLADAGKEIVPFRGEHLTPDAVAGFIEPQSDTPSSTDVVTIKLGSGWLRIDDQSASFSDRGASHAISNGVYTATSLWGNRLPSMHIDAVLKRARSLATLTTDDEQQLIAMLELPNQPYVTPAVTPAQAAAQLASVIVDEDGYILFDFINGQAFELAGSAAGNDALFNVNTTAVYTSLLEGALSLGLAVFLLTVGIMTLRRSPRGRRLHMIYIALKIPAALMGTAAAIYFGVSYFSMTNPTPQTSQSFLNYANIVTSLVFLVLTLGYPAFLLYALNVKPVKEYYAPSPSS